MIKLGFCLEKQNVPISDLDKLVPIVSYLQNSVPEIQPCCYNSILKFFVPILHSLIASFAPNTSD